MRSPSSSSLDTPARVARVLFAVLMGYAWASWPVLAQAPAPVPTGSPAAPASTMKPAELADHLDRMFDLLAEVQRALPRDTFDPQAIVEQVGRDPAALFAWVRDNTYFVPYDGCLKGPAGVLMDRVGNSLDRALLLAQLLGESGYDVRLARAPLDPAGVDGWRAEVRPVPVNRFGAPRTDDRGGDLLRAASTRCRVDLASLRQQVDPHLAQSRAQAEAARQRVSEQTAAVLSAVGDRGGAANASSAGPTTTDHWWVRYRAAAGAWTDLDPTLPDAAPGQRTVPIKGNAQEVPLGHAGRPPLPDGPWWHEVVVRVVVERRAPDDVVEQHVALQHPLRPALLHGAVVQLSHRPLDWPARQRAGDVKQFEAAVAGAKRWTPVLVVGAQVIYQKGFDDAGRVFDNPYSASSNTEISRSAGGGGASGGMFGALEGADAGPTTTAAAGQGTLSAAWIEYEIRSPGRDARKIRREVFDLVGPVARAAGDKAEPKLTDAQRLDRGLRLLGETQVLAQACRPSDAFVAHAYARAMLANRRALVAVAAACGKDPAAVEGAMGRVRPMPAGVYGFAATREAWTAAPASGAAVYLDTPNVLNYRTRLERGAADGRYRSVAMFDLVNNDVAVAGGAGVDAFAARVEQGVADTVAEDVLAGGGDPASDGLENTADVLAAAAAQGIASATVRGKADAAALAQLDWPDAARLRAADCLNDGCWVVAPRQALAAADGAGGEGNARRVGWYRVDPATGTTVGVMDNGFHAGTTEDSLKQAEVLFAKIAPYINNGNVGAQNALIELTMMAARATAGEAAATFTAGEVVGIVLGGIAFGLMLVGTLIVEKQ